MSDFKAGDVVQLKSGGPKMTVTSVGDDFGGKPSVFVTWFDDKQKPQTGAYPIETVDRW